MAKVGAVSRPTATKAYLLDTCALLYWAKGTMVQELQKFLQRPDIPVYLSAVSLWEIAIKRHKDNKNKTNKLVMSDADFNKLDEIVEGQLRIIPLQKTPIKIFADVSSGCETKDPFDRMLMSQAIENHLEFITTDQKIMKSKIPKFYCYQSKVK
ncbi:type II toxin-antitoxin system VapC family toxin [Candidatus Haliotispira prima]|uniref:Type II toxin-antitoxin system VapC family toxin n=1 Tax=Candidatus Haliotispira prima TaxID=3034016 RepID=A0ABY8MHE3_9SPIO|nr:type II toxin-antitoxin system VapC family toxin [Candidatus Haliotispira prima]